ncbi:G/U mismatch-specific DNA glycosylase [Variovorax sp. GT1P44]|uniref:G/U mismatch-specific DNA glycosylase n=1 Tax=Variovorax sp. GT1P44 TaxID=3443742 RepID=UPI003F48BC3D
MNAVTKGLPDVLADGLDVVFCGINPGSRAVASGHHFDGRGNRFWRVMHLAGFTPELLTPAQDRLLLAHGCGLTTVVDRCTSRASELARREFLAAADGFIEKIRACGPHRLAFLGKPAYAALTGQKQVAWGRQPMRFADRETWVLPNPSGLNRAFSLDDLVVAYRELRNAIPSTRAVSQRSRRLSP